MSQGMEPTYIQMYMQQSDYIAARFVHIFLIMWLIYKALNKRRLSIYIILRFLTIWQEGPRLLQTFFIASTSLVSIPDICYLLYENFLPIKIVIQGTTIHLRVWYKNIFYRYAFFPRTRIFPTWYGYEFE